MASSSSSASSPQTSSSYRSRFGDTTFTKVFVGGLAWETPTAELRRYFEQFGEILEAVIITDKVTGRSKGYGFVTFREPESARRSVADPNPVIDGRRANCNIAAFGRPSRPSPQQGRNQDGSMQQGRPQPLGPPYGRVPAQVPPPPPVIYPTPYGERCTTPKWHPTTISNCMDQPHHQPLVLHPTTTLIWGTPCSLLGQGFLL